MKLKVRTVTADARKLYLSPRGYGPAPVVDSVDPKKGKVRVEKVRVQKRHLKPGRRAARTGGIIEQEGYIDASRVMLVDPSDKQPSRTRIEERDGRRVRVFARSGETVPDPART